MKVHWLEMRHYRGVQERRVDFSLTGITIVRGPNESGKSSIVEALRLLLDLPHDSRRAKVRAIKPVQGDFGPEVAALFELGGLMCEYRKKWLKEPFTQLQVLSPSPRQLSGREAHDFISHELDSNLDRALFDALRYVQGEAVAQHSLVRSTSLMASLDAATSASARELDGGSTVADAVQREYEKYFTKAGKYRDEHRRLQSLVQESQDRLDKARDELANLEVVGDSLRRTVADISEREELLSEATAELDSQTHKQELCRVRKQSYDDAEVALNRAATDVQMQEDRVLARHGLIAQQERALREREQLLGELGGLGREIGDLGEKLRIATDDRDQAQREFSDANSEAERASEISEWCRNKEDLARLVGKLNNVRKTKAELDAARRIVFEYQDVDHGLLTEIERAVDGVMRCEAELSAGQTSFAIKARRESVLEVDGVRETLTDQESRNVVAHAGMVFVFDDALEVVVQGPSLVELEEALTRAKTVRDRLVSSHHLDPKGPRSDLEARLREKMSATERSQHLKSQLDDALGGSDEDDLYQQCEVLNAKIAEVDLLGEVSLMMARKVSEAAGQRRRLCEDQLQVSTKRVARLKLQWDDLRNQRSKCEGSLQIVIQNLERATSELDRARELQQDATVESTLEAARAAKEVAKGALEAARAAYLELQPESIAALAENLEAQIAQMRDEQQQASQKREQLKGQLVGLGDKDLQAGFDAADATDAENRRRLESHERQARAAKLLYETFARHRDLARESRAAPFAKEVNRLAQFVFGRDVSIAVDPQDLSIGSRTLNGATVEYGELSTGAREQLSVVATLACALLVCKKEPGVPVILDDALGFSDRERLGGLGLVFQEAGRSVQIILLTASTTRYSSVGSAKVVEVS